jgi:hypothetical protein
MAGRGSGIGLGFSGGLGAGGVGPSNTSTRPAAPGQLYGPKIKNGASNMGVHHYLWLLVAIEMGILVLLRAVVFKQYHGG